MKLELASLSAVARNHVECTLKWLAASCHLSRFNHRTDTLCANVCVCVCLWWYSRKRWMSVSLLKWLDCKQHDVFRMSLKARSWVEIWATCFIAFHSVNSIKYVLFCIQVWCFHYFVVLAQKHFHFLYVAPMLFSLLFILSSFFSFTL